MYLSTAGIRAIAFRVDWVLSTNRAIESLAALSNWAIMKIRVWFIKKNPPFLGIPSAQSLGTVGPPKMGDFFLTNQTQYCYNGPAEQGC